MRLYIKLMIEGWKKNLKEGFTQKSAMKFGKSVGVSPKEHGFFEACTKKMEGKVDDPAEFCAAVKDKAYQSTYWRGKGKSKSRINKDTKIKNRKD